MVNTKSNNPNNTVTITNNNAKYYSDLSLGYANQSKNYADSIKNTQTEINTLLANENFSVVKDSINNINTVAENINNIDGFTTEWGNITGDILKQEDLKTVLASKADTTNLPTKTSDLTNDSGFITSIPDNITTQGNTFNSADKLVKLDSSGKLPALDGSQLTGISASGSNSPSIQYDGSITSMTGTINLQTNKIYSGNQTGNITFSLPSTVDNTIFNQILVQLGVDTAYTISLGATDYFNDTAPVINTAGRYNIIYEYDNYNGHWAVGAVFKGTMLHEGFGDGGYDW